MNTVTIIKRDVYINGRDVLFRKGQVIICIRNLHLIAVLDIDKSEFVWMWGPGHLDYPHHPTLLDNGNILIFDNGKRKKISRVIELDPTDYEIDWQYYGTPPKSFFSDTRGAAQRLPNGNTLITDSRKGRVFEVTKDGEIVWDYYSPEIIPESKE